MGHFKCYLGVKKSVKVHNYLLILLLSMGAITGCKFPRTAPPSSESWFVMRVSDGDSLTVRQTDGSELKIRLCGIDAPERSQPLGREATENLRSLVAETDNQVQVVALEKDRYGRTVAEVFIVLKNEEKMLNAEQLMSGNAYLYKEYVKTCPNRIPLETAEAIAQEKRLGVWGGNYQKPWDYRRSKRK